MELLLFLSALLASLTGVISGDRSAELRQVRAAQMASIAAPARPCAQKEAPTHRAPRAIPRLEPHDIMPPYPRGSDVRASILLLTQRRLE